MGMIRLISGWTWTTARSRWIPTLLALALGCGAEGSGKRLLAIMPPGDTFLQAWSGMKSDLGGRYEWRVLDPDAKNAEDTLAALCATYAPHALVLMDTRAVSLAKRMQKRDTALASLPKFILMTLKAEDAAQELQGALGIRFEAPAYAVFTQLRALSGQEFTRIGVFHRRVFSPFVEESRRLLSREKLELIGKCLDCDGSGPPSESEIVKRLGRGMDEFRSADVEVVWMLPDNTLVNPATLGRFWAPRFRRGTVPLIVPLAHLAGKQADLGLFSAYPDYYQLGVQAAQQVVQVIEGSVQPSAIGFEPLISIQTTLNLGVAKRLRWEIRKDKLPRVGDLIQP
ncbi:MAG: hypothetical protein ABIW76_11195 [Fibrobacteria bacterium]